MGFRSPQPIAELDSITRSKPAAAFSLVVDGSLAKPSLPAESFVGMMTPALISLALASLSMLSYASCSEPSAPNPLN